MKQIQATIDYYVNTPDDTVVEGEIEAGKIYDELDFNKSIEIRERERKRVEIFMSQINQNEKTLVFCANRSHPLLVRDLINQVKKSREPNYCQRVTANDGRLGEQYLRDFQDNEKSIPTILSGASKWNPIEHRCFSEISKRWAGQPLDTCSTIVSLIGSTTTQTGLQVRSQLIMKHYPTKLKVSDLDMQRINLHRHSTLPAWNYTISPRENRN